MANKKISGMTELDATPASVDKVPLVDVSDTTGAATGTTKWVSVDNLISEVAVSDMAASAVVTEAEGISSSDNDTSLPTSAAVKDYVDGSAGSGTVTSVAVTGSDGIEVDSGSPIESTGTIALGLSNIDATKIADGTVTDAEFQYIGGLTSDAQTQITAKAAKGANGDITSLTGLTTDLAITHGGTGSSTAQAAIDALSAVAGADDEYVLTKDTSTGNATWKVAPGAGAGIDNVSEDTTPQLGGDLDCNGNQIQWSKGADVASGGALPVLTDGNYFDVTGTSSITSIDTTAVGTLIKLHFDGALTLTHHSTDLVLPGEDDITTAAGDEAEFVEYASGDWRCTNYSKADGTPVVGGGGDITGVTAGTNLSGGGTSGTVTLNLDNPVIANLTGNASGSSGSCTGNAATATALETARTIGGTSFDGTANIVPATITVADTTDTTCSVGLFESATGDLAPKSDAGLTYNAGTGTLTATAFAGPLEGNVTGNVTGNASGLSATLAVANGGTGATTLSAKSLLVGADTSAVTALLMDTPGNIAIGGASGPVSGVLTAGDGLVSTTGDGTLELDLDLKANGGCVFESNELAVDLAASSITGTLAAGDGGTGLTAITTLLNSNVTPTTLGLVIGTNVQAWDAELDTLAALTEARGSLIVGNSTPAWSALALGSANAVLTSDGTDAAWTALPVEIGVACSDETTALTTGSDKATLMIPEAMTLTEVKASLSGADTDASGLDIDVRYHATDPTDAGATVFSSGDLNVDKDAFYGNNTSLAVTALAENSFIMVDINGPTTPDATGLKIWLIGTRA